MNKFLKAEKVKNGWYVQITETLFMPYHQDVFKYCCENGFIIDQKLLELQDNIIIAKKPIDKRWYSIYWNL